MDGQLPLIASSFFNFPKVAGGGRAAPHVPVLSGQDPVPALNRNATPEEAIQCFKTLAQIVSREMKLTAQELVGEVGNVNKQQFDQHETKSSEECCSPLPEEDYNQNSIPEKDSVRRLTQLELKSGCCDQTSLQHPLEEQETLPTTPEQVTYEFITNRHIERTTASKVIAGIESRLGNSSLSSNETCSSVESFELPCSHVESGSTGSVSSKSESSEVEPSDNMLSKMSEQYAGKIGTVPNNHPSVQETLTANTAVSNNGLSATDELEVHRRLMQRQLARQAKEYLEELERFDKSGENQVCEDTPSGNVDFFHHTIVNESSPSEDHGTRTSHDELQHDTCDEFALGCSPIPVAVISPIATPSDSIEKVDSVSVTRNKQVQLEQSMGDTNNNISTQLEQEVGNTNNESTQLEQETGNTNNESTQLEQETGIANNAVLLNGAPSPPPPPEQAEEFLSLIVQHLGTSGINSTDAVQASEWEET